MKINSLVAFVVAASVTLPVAGFSADQTQVQKLRELECRALSLDGRDYVVVSIVDFKTVTDGQEKYSSKIHVSGPGSFSGATETDKDPTEDRDSDGGWGGLLVYTSLQAQDAASGAREVAVLTKPKVMANDEDSSVRSYFLAVGQVSDDLDMEKVKFQGFLGCSLR